MSSKKIALIGTSCVGKTSILEELKKKFPQHVFINEVAREYFLKKKTRNRFSFQDQKNIQDLVIEREKMIPGKIYVCDRSVICPIIYTKAAGNLKGGDLLFKRVGTWINTYTHLILLDPKEVPYQNDNIRDEDKAFRMKVHDEYIAFLDKNNIQYTLITGTWNERISKIEESIKSHRYA